MLKTRASSRACSLRQAMYSCALERSGRGDRPVALHDVAHSPAAACRNTQASQFWPSAPKM
eukprot:3843367-Pyramimonas_sp.AAC.1